jgi:glutamate racemase
VSYQRASGVQLVVVACHTASSCALQTLRDRFDLPVLGVTTPGGRAAAAASRNGRIGVIGTRATVASGAFEREIRANRPDAHVISRPCPLFVPLVEEGWEDSEVARMVAASYLEPFRGEGVDTMVLGCTHYPLLRPVIRELVGDGVTLVDPGEETAREVADLLAREGMARDARAGEPAFRFVVSDVTSRMRVLARSCLGREVQEPEVVPLETLEEMERST